MQLFAGVIGNLHPPQNSVDAGDKLLHLKGLDDVIVRAHLKALNTVKDLAFGSQHDDGDLAGLPDFGADSPAVHHRQHDVQQYQIRLLCPKFLQRLASVSGDADVKALLHQIHIDEIGNVLVILYYQNIASHTLSSSFAGHRPVFSL